MIQATAHSGMGNAKRCCSVCSNIAPITNIPEQLISEICKSKKE